MEPVSLAVSIASLAPLFQTALDCFQYVQLGKSFSTDFQTCLLQLDNIQLRLSRWGQAIGIGADTESTLSLSGTSISPEDQRRAETILGHVISLFKDAESVSRRLEGKSSDVQQMQAHESLEGVIASLHKRMRGICLRRQGKTSIDTKTKWALHERDHLIHLIESVQTLVTDLIDLFPSTEKRERIFCDEEVAELRDESELPVLIEVAGKLDQPLKEAIERLQKQVVSTSSETGSYILTRPDISHLQYVEQLGQYQSP